MVQLLGTSCWYRDNCITKLWNLSSYFLYLYMVSIQHCFHLEQHCFHIDRQFSCSPNISNWLSRVPTQSSLVIQNSCSSWLSCTLSRCLHLLSWSDVTSHFSVPWWSTHQSSVHGWGIGVQTQWVFPLPRRRPPWPPAPTFGVFQLSRPWIAVHGPWVELYASL